ncbi:hypothetical protein BD779DRAFT_1506285 [Infundibulicybe gibba]|nr:hypothetical protein BD779DRAFT_1506285 [Infundibulicybe gibba]
MTLATSSELARQYSEELAAYTLRQFSAARSTLDGHKAAANKLPAVHSHDYSKGSRRRRKEPSGDVRKLGDQNKEVNVPKPRETPTKA